MNFIAQATKVSATINRGETPLPLGFIYRIPLHVFLDFTINFMKPYQRRPLRSACFMRLKMITIFV